MADHIDKSCGLMCDVEDLKMYDKIIHYLIAFSPNSIKAEPSCTYIIKKVSCFCLILGLMLLLLFTFLHSL